MGCKGCGRGSERNKPTVMVGDVDGEKQVVAGVKRGSLKTTVEQAKEVQAKSPVAPPTEEDKVEVQPNTYQEIIQEVRRLSFDEIMTRAGLQQKQAALDVERAFAEMTDAMRHFHILNLLSVANFENLASPGLSPDQAVVGLKTALDRKDFSDINKLYPTLRDQVGRRYKELIDKKITL